MTIEQSLTYQEHGDLHPRIIYLQLGSLSEIPVTALGGLPAELPRRFDAVKPQGSVIAFHLSGPPSDPLGNCEHARHHRFDAGMLERRLGMTCFQVRLCAGLRP